MFGINAGIVWKALNDNGPSTIESLVETRLLVAKKYLVH